MLLAALLLLAILFASATGVTQSSWTVGKVANSNNKAEVATLSFTHSYDGQTCSKSTSGSVSCSDTLSPNSGPPATGTSTMLDTIKNDGTAPGASLSAKVSIDNCYVVGIASEGAASSGVWLPRNGMLFEQPDPWGTRHAWSFDGINDYLAAQNATSTASTWPNDYGVSLWFKTNASAGQPLAGWFAGSDNTGTANAATDRLLYMLPSGQVAYWSGSQRAVSPASYNDGQWHNVYAHLDTGDGKFYLSVDGTTVSTVGSFTQPTGPLYWHVAYSPMKSYTGITGSATYSNYFRGSMTHVAMYDNGNGNWYNFGGGAGGTESGYEGWETGYGSDTYLRSKGNGYTQYSGGSWPADWGMPSATNPCSYLNVQWQLAGPSGDVVNSITGSSTATAAALSGKTSGNLALPASGASQTSTISTSRASGYYARANGVHLYMPIRYSVSAATSTSAPKWQLDFAWSTDPYRSIFLG